MKMRVIFPVNTTLEIAIIKPEKNSGLYEIWTHDFCDIPTELTNPLGALSVCKNPCCDGWRKHDRAYTWRSLISYHVSLVHG